MSKSRAEVNEHLYNDTKPTGISAEYVVAHALRQSQRGKRPSVSFNGISNPAESLKAAQDLVASKTLENPADVLALEHGSILDWVIAHGEENRRAVFSGIELLSDAETEVRVRFIEEMNTAWNNYHGSSKPEDSLIDTLYFVQRQIGWYEPKETRDIFYSAWGEDLEAAIEALHPTPVTPIVN